MADMVRALISGAVRSDVDDAVPVTLLLDDLAGEHFQSEHPTARAAIAAAEEVIGGTVRWSWDAGRRQWRGVAVDA